jgi:hypothetical protein
MEKTHIPTWAEANGVPYNRRTRLEHFIYEHDPGKTSENFSLMLSNAIEQIKRNTIKGSKSRNKNKPD